MQTYDFSPFYRSTVGFDRLFSRLDDVVGQEAKSYPPYNIERFSDDSWRVSVAVAGFKADDISIETKENSLTIKGAHSASKAESERKFLHRGIAERSFDLRFQLGDHVEVTGASLENGLLNIDLKLELPESKKPRQIAINDGSKTVEVEKTIEDKTVN